MPPRRHRTSAQFLVPKVEEDGDWFGPYRILDTLGKGSMGRVYRARDPAGRDVALKVILKTMADEEGLARFRREGEASAAIPRHPNVVSVHTTGEHQGHPYLVFDYVDGDSLADVLKRGPLSPSKAVWVVARLARAVEHVHRAGVIHRDLKPANVLVRREDQQPVVTDFGVAGLRGADRLTQTGDMLGTPVYMAPEQVSGTRDTDARTDVWALGVILFEAMAGDPPFSGNTLVDIAQSITFDPPASLRGACAEVDAELEAIVYQALTKEAGGRQATPGELASQLESWLLRSNQGSTKRAPTGRWIGVGVAMGILVVGAIVWASGGEGEPVAVVEEAAPAPAEPAVAEPAPTPAPVEVEERANEGALRLEEAARVGSWREFRNRAVALRGELSAPAVGSETFEALGRAWAAARAAGPELSLGEDLQALLGGLGEVTGLLAGDGTRRLSTGRRAALPPLPSGTAPESEWSRRLFAELAARSGSLSLSELEAWVKTLAGAGVRGTGSREAGEVLDGLLLSFTMRGSAPAQVWDALRDFAALDVDLMHGHVVNLRGAPEWLASSNDPYQRFVSLRVAAERAGAERAARARAELWDWAREHRHRVGAAVYVRALVEASDVVEPWEAIEALESARRTSGDNPILHECLATLYASNGQVPEAMRAAQEALDVLDEGWTVRSMTRVEVRGMYRTYVVVHVQGHQLERARRAVEDYQSVTNATPNDRGELRERFAELTAR